MSRTFRLRHDPALVAKRFTDGQLYIHIEEVLSYWYGIIAHGIFNCPCLVVGKKLIEYNDANYGGTTMDFTSHDTCMYPILARWSTKNVLVESISGAHRYKVAPMYLHPYARPGRRCASRLYGNHNWKYMSRLTSKRKLHKALVSGHYDDV